ncbi:MAG: hypothetical protein IRZ33_00335 [Alicyclobacillaceae bacterium]|nr:hypothetical protein [Alicyclobacillaceae bacterium]
MQLDTLVKLGSLALQVAQDDKVRQLASLIHRGAKRRGILPPPPILPAPPVAASNHAGGATAAPQPAPKAKGQTGTGSSAAAPTPWIPFGPPGLPLQAYGGSGIMKYLTADNAKKVLEVAGVMKGLLGK